MNKENHQIAIKTYQRIINKMEQLKPYQNGKQNINNLLIILDIIKN